jgi:hypothetical protein
VYIYVWQGGGPRRPLIFCNAVTFRPVGVKQTEKHLCALTVNRFYVNWRYSCSSIGNGASVRHTAPSSGTIFIVSLDVTN